MNGSMVVLTVWAASVALVALAATAKLLAWNATRDAWPVDAPGLRTVLGPLPVTAAEIAAVLLAVAPLPAGVRLTGLGLLYATYAVASLLLRGRPCACFGQTFVTRFTAAHAVATAVAAVALLAGAAGGRPGGAAMSVTAALATLLGTVAALAGRLGRRRTEQRVADPAEVPPVDHVVVYGSPGCPGCRGVWAQKEQLLAIAACPVDFRLVSEEEAMRHAGGAIPAAIGYGPDGSQVFGPVAGLSAIRNLLVATDRQAVGR
jgi:hypothetical protein